MGSKLALLPCYNTSRYYTVFLERHVRSLNMHASEGRNEEGSKERLGILNLLFMIDNVLIST